MAEETSNNSNILKDKSAVSVAIATLLLLLLSFWAFNSFNRNDIEDELNGDGIEDALVDEEESEENGEEQEETEGEEESTEEETAAEEQEEEPQEEVAETEQEQQASSEEQAVEEGTGGAVQGTQTATWTANNYNQGELSGDTYTVKQGDTLWEIAEGYTGNGGNWQQIADANNVQYNSLGNPIIQTGQTLTIPSLQ